ncbi:MULTISPECIES: hypothetical protein [unclassified Shewanella]|uniref:hypothetical protein n=1 Tax=unclassified Shewanella TaxID=196818 RepID=UPI001BC3E37E|nr:MULTISPECIES: hypothetical protein [unclassified Shewanella]GIU05651.1 hypothetical protein TUM4444_02340 [Shewanella sp. MBTL60-112-B1]GIU23743.1 hypothetical protein TUM4445_00030 [Shewanella sp. MBTL60-112-B2]
MDAFSQLQVIEFNRHDSASIEQALKAYQAQLEAHLAFDKGGRFNLMFMDNSSGTREHLQLDMLQDQQLAMAALSLNPDGGHLSSYLVSDERLLYLSETLLFALALEHESLTPQLRKTAQAMVNYARFENDTSEMWLDDTRVFGAEPMYMMAAKDANDATYLAQFFIPYWDDDHAVGYGDMLLSLLRKHGWCEAMMNAFIWCDNHSFRFAFYGSDWEQPAPRYQPLGDYLKANPDKYPRFIELVKQRFHAQPALVYSQHDSLEEQKPILNLYITLIAECCGLDSEGMSAELAEHFIDDSLENEAMDLQNLLKHELNGKLCCYAGSIARQKELRLQRADREQARDKYLGGLKMVNEFMLSLENSHTLLSYISTGENPEILDDIECFNIIPHSEKHALTLYEAIQESCWDMDDFDHVRDNFHEVMEHLAKDLLLEVDEDMSEAAINGFISRVSARADTHCNDTETAAANTQPESRVRDAQTMLRFVDIFYRFFGQQAFNDEMCDMLTGESEYQAIISVEQYYARFMPTDATPKLDSGVSRTEQKALESLLDEFIDMGYNQISAEMLKQTDELFANRACLDCQDWPEDELGIDALCAYLLLQDKQQNQNDGYTQALQAKLNGVFERALNLMLENANILGDGPCTEKGLNDVEQAQIKAYFTDTNPELNQQQMIELLDQHLFSQDICRQAFLYFPKISPVQKNYSFLDDHDDDYQRVVLACLWLKQLDIPEAINAERIWQLLITMAPIRVVHVVAKAFSEHSRKFKCDSPLDEINFFDMLNSHSIDKAFILAYQVEQFSTSTSRTGDYLNLVELIGELVDEDSAIIDQSMLAAARRSDAKALLRGLDYSYQPIKLDFHKHVAMRFPSMPFALDNELKQCLSDFIKLNHNSWEEVIESKFTDYVSFSGFVTDAGELPKKLRLPLTLHPNADLSQTRRNDRMDWICCEILQQVGDELQVLVADKDTVRDGNLYLGGEVLILNDKVDAQSVIDAVKNLPSPEERRNQVNQNLWAYLQGELEYAEFAPQFNQYVSYETTANLKEYRSHALSQYLWLLDDERCGRLVELLANHSYAAYKVFTDGLVDSYMDQLALQGKMNLATRLACDEDDYEEAAFQALLDWLFSRNVKREYLLLYMIKKYRPCMGEYIAAMARRDEIKPLMGFLRIETKATLVDILAKQANGSEFMTLFAKEKSRKIRDRVEAALS